MVDDTVVVDSCAIAHSRTGTAGVPVVLVHGARAHRGWWHLVVPALAEAHRVIALDLSGHGSSGRRDGYGPRVYGRDVAGILDAVVDEPCVLVGHSMGGIAGIVAAAARPERVAALVLLDTLLKPAGRRRNHRLPVVPLRTFPTAAEARARFRLAPDQPDLPAEVMGPVLDGAVVPAPGGWSWAFDPVARGVFEDDFVDGELGRLACPVTYVRAGLSALRNVEAVGEVVRHHPGARVVEVADGHHHLPLDSPRACVEAITVAARDVGSGAVPDPTHH